MDVHVVNQVLSLMFMMGVGVILKKAKVMNSEMMKGLSIILINVTLPFLIIFSFDFKYSERMMENGLVMFASSFIIHTILILISYLFYFRYEQSKRGVFQFCTIFSNCGFIGYPLIQSIYGKIGVFYTSIYTLPFNIFAFTYGVMLFTGKGSIFQYIKSLVNLPVIATALGILFFLYSVDLPLPVKTALGSIGNMTTPISMLIIGSMLADVKVIEIFSGMDVYYLSLLKLLVLPICFFYGLKVVHLDSSVRDIIILLIAMPTATLVGVFAENYNVNKMDASRCVFLTTVLSMITIPFIASIL